MNVLGEAPAIRPMSSMGGDDEGRLRDGAGALERLLTVTECGPR